jgi:hypothetical protein
MRTVIKIGVGVAVAACLLLVLSHKHPSDQSIDASEAPGQSAGNVSAADYLPLDVGKKWVLRNEHTAPTITLTVEGIENGVATVSFQNPWFDSKFLFRESGAQVLLDALEVKSQRMAMPAETVYFDFSAPEGKPWQNTIGSMQVVAIHKQLGKYDECIQIQETNKQGHKNLWSFAKGIGFVQFGSGRDAFVLDESASNLVGGSLPEKPTGEGAASEAAAPINSAAPAVVPAGWGNTRIALAHNPFANEPLTPFTVNSRFRQAVDAGVDYVYLSPKWEELEPSPGKYKFNDLDFQVGQAEKAGLPTILNIRVIDTGARPVPSDLKNKSFQDREMIDRLNALIDALSSHLKTRPAYLLIGNEINEYFDAHSNEVSGYAALFAAAKAHAQAKWDGVPTSTTITFGGLDKVSGQLLPITRQTDFFSLTYYPLKPDFTVRDPSQIPPDFERISRTAHGKKILFQEVGYPSSEKNDSSQDKQALAYSTFLDTLAGHKSEVIGASFLFMSDFSDSVTRDLATSYHLQNADRFGAFLQTLGLFDGNGNPKKSWAVFTTKVPRITGHN